MHTQLLSGTAALAAVMLSLPSGATPPHATPPSSTEVAQAQAMLAGKSVPVFHDTEGHVITSAVFTAAVKAGQRFTITHDARTNQYVMSLVPRGAKVAGSQSFSMTARIPKPGTTFAAFDLPAVGGGHIAATQFKGKPYVVDFFFADCVGCIAELPQLNAFRKQYPQQPLVAITFDDAKVAAGFVKQRKFNWPVAYNGLAFDKKLGVKVFPTMVVVSAGGKVLATRVGAQTGTTPASLEHWITVSVDKAHAQHAAG